MKKNKIVLVEDHHSSVRKALCDILESTADFTVVGIDTSGQEATNLCEKWQPEIVLLDLTLTEKSGVEILGEINDTFPRLKVVIHSQHSGRGMLSCVFRHQIASYIHKEDEVSLIPGILRKAMQGQFYASPAITDFLWKWKKDPNVLPHERLSPKESQVFWLMIGGKSQEKIAQELANASSTIDSHRKKIYEKLHLSNRNELTLYAAEHGLVRNIHLYPKTFSPSSK